MEFIKRLKEICRYFINSKVLQALVVAIAFSTVFALSTSNILYLIVALLYIFVSKYNMRFTNRKEKIATIVVSILLSAFLILGKFECVLNVEYLIAWPIAVAICFWGIYLCFYQLIGRMYISLLDSTTKCVVSKEATKRSFLKAYFLSLISFVFVILISLAISYPGNNTRDSIGYLEIAFNDAGMMAAAPIIYSFYLKWIWNMGDFLFHSANASFALCMFVQAFLIALMESYIIAKVYVRGIKKRYCILIWLFYGMIPYNLQLPHTLWKDIPFAMFTLLLTVLLFYACDSKKKNKFLNGLNIVGIMIACIGMSLMRTNGYFAFLFILPICIWCFWKDNKKIVITLILSFVMVRLIQGPIYDNIITKQIKLVQMKAEQKLDEEEQTEELKLSDVEIVEGEDIIAEDVVDSYNASGITNITIQQLARVAVEIEDLSEQDYNRLAKILDIEKAKEKYNPYCRDDIAYAMATEMKYMSTGKYLSEWLYFGLKYPMQYILAYRDQTYGYYYPDIQYWVYTDQIQDALTEKYGVYKDSILTDSQRVKWLEFEEIYKKVPLYGLLWSIGFMVWLGFFAAGAVYCKKGLRELIVFVPVLGVWMTLMVATPVFAEFRYMYSLFLCIPLWFAMIFLPKDGEIEASALLNKRVK